MSDRFKYLIAGDALAHKNNYYEYYTKQEMRTILSKLEEIKGLIPANANDITKFMIMYKWIEYHANYNLSAKEDKFLKVFSHQEAQEDIMRITSSLIGVLIRGDAICAGFSWAMVTCLNYIGMPARVVAGKSANGSLHAWIHAKIDGIWYNACLTSDNKNIKLQKPLKFCLRSDAYFKKMGAVFQNYCIDIDEKNEVIPLEVCTSDYPRDSEGNLLNDKSFFIDEHCKHLSKFYEKILENGEIKKVVREEKGKTLTRPMMGIKRKIYSINGNRDSFTNS